jgi:hypothetical protein
VFMPDRREHPVMRRVLCPCCRTLVAATARAAIDVLSDPAVDDAERAIATDTLCDALAHLRLPSAEVSP